MDKAFSSALRLHAAIEKWPLAAPFVISRGAKTEAQVVVVTLGCENFIGRGECVPYARYQESPEATLTTILNHGILSSRENLQQSLPACAARNALDCAFWDLEAKMSGISVSKLANRPFPHPQRTCFTISLDTPEKMANAAKAVPQLQLLKLKLGGEKDQDRMKAVRAQRPDARLLADANEAWCPENLQLLLDVARDLNFELVEQPLPAGQDDALSKCNRVIPVCADESVHTNKDISSLLNRYDAINIKLDKAGGLTEAFAMVDTAQALGLKIMIGSMVATSLAVAPAMMLSPFATWLDLDGPLLLSQDRSPSLKIDNGIIEPPRAELWG